MWQYRLPAPRRHGHESQEANELCEALPSRVLHVKDHHNLIKQRGFVKEGVWEG
jgi:hypothetical protein